MVVSVSSLLRTSAGKLDTRHIAGESGVAIRQLEETAGPASYSQVWPIGQEGAKGEASKPGDFDRRAHGRPVKKKKVK
jgi:hypothetical protein